jgi:hypothetical protein
MFLANIERCFRGVIAAVLLTLVIGCGFPGGNGGGGGGGGGGAVPTPTLLNLADAAPDRVLALSLTITEIKFHQTSGASVSALNSAGGLTVEMTHRQALFEPINLTTTTILPGTYDSAVITLASAAVTFVDNAGVVQQDLSPTITGATTTVSLPANFVNSGPTTPIVLNVQFLPSSVSINLTTNKATITPAYTVAAVLAATPTTTQNEATGLVRQITGTLTATPAAGATTFTISSSQLANPLTINTDGSTALSGDVSNFPSLVAGNIVEVQAVTVTSTPNLLAKTIDGENAGVGMTTGADLQGAITTEVVNLLAPFNVDSFAFRVQNAASTSAAPPLGSAITVSDFSAPTTFVIDQQDVDLTNLPFTAAFDRVHIRRVQDISAIYASAAATTAPKKLKLKLQTMAGTVGVISNGSVINQQLIVFTPPADSIFTLLTGQTTLTVIQQPSTVAAAAATPGNPLHVRGLLFFDTVSGKYFLVADQFTP